MDDIFITTDYFGGEEGFKSILNDYYENEINELSEAQRLRARKFIEEGLILGERRVGITEGVEKERYGIDEHLLKQLLDSRLIRAENTHLGKSYEVSHDTLVAPILESFQKRKFREEREAKAKELRIARWKLITAGSIALFGFALAIVALYFGIQAQKALEEVKKQQLISATERYNKHIESGDKWLHAEDYIKAEKEFTKAREVITNYAFIIKDSTAEKLIDSGGFKAESGLQQVQGNKGSKEVFDQLIKQADSLQNKLGPEFLVDAKSRYQEAVDIHHKNALAKEGLNEVEWKLKNAYREFLRVGEIFFKAGNYPLALEQFQHAQRIKPKDRVVADWIKKCERGLE